MRNRALIFFFVFAGFILHTGFADRPPKFIKFMNYEEIAENTEPGTIVYQLYGTDPEGRRVRYGVKGDVFYVEENSGNVQLNRRLDFERNQYLIVQFTISDGVNLVEKTATIYLKDVNDVKPVFTQSTYFKEIKESFPIGGIVIDNITVTDIEGTNDLIKVRCEPGTSYINDCQTFKVVTTGTLSNSRWTGRLVLNKALNYESKKNYQVPLVANDGVNNQTKSVEIRVLDVPDLPPYFVRALSVAINEETPPGTIITKVTAEDGDKFSPRPLKYSIYNDTHKLFRIDADTGDISVAKRLDREDNLLRIGYSDVYLKVQEVVQKNPLQLGNTASTTATTTIRISIMDINDNKPEFTSSYTATIPEDISNNVAIPNLLMTVIDRDAGTNANYVFEIDQYSDRFYIQPNYGEGISTSAIRVKNTSLIDYEKGPKIYKFQVTAREPNTTEKYSGTTTVTIYVTDINDNAPIPSSPFYVASINELAVAGTPVTTIQATDLDSGKFGTAGIVYKSLRGMFSNLFELDAFSGKVTVGMCPTPGKYPCMDYETRKQINLTAEIVDNEDGMSTQRTLVNLIIDITDSNDNKPVFPSTQYYGKIAEGSKEPSPEVIVKAEDIDITSNVIRYSILNSEVSGLFIIDSSSGKITASRPVKLSDGGSDKYVTMDVIASDSKFSGKTSVRIEILDKNNNRPLFQQNFYNTCIPEDFSGGQLVLKAKATDGDRQGTPNAKLSYAIATGAEGQFAIDQNGDLKSSFQARFDYERKKSYTFLIIVRDNGSPQLSSSATVNICINDVNDNTPTFIPFSVRVSVKEDAPVGYSVVKLNAVDPDTNSNLVYKFVEPSSAINPNGVEVDRTVYDYTSLFSLDPNTGEIKVAKTLEREKANLITQTLNVIDTNGVKGQTGTGTIYINIQDVNKIPPVFSLPWTKTSPFYNVTINEEQSIGSFVTILNAIDQDGSIEGYSINDPGGYFSIRNGVVTIKKRIDYEKVESLRFLAYAWDNVEPKMTATATVNVEIKNINDNTPQFKNLYNPIIDENSPVGTRVVQVTATDNDKGDYGRVRYEIADPKSAFQIGLITGEITVKNSKVLDRENVNQIVVPVTAYDSPQDSTVRLNTTVPVYIELRDLNDNPPVFERKSYYETVVESIPIGSRIIDISARDKDAGKNAIIFYSKVSGDSEDLFDISPNGAVTVKKNLMNKIGNHTFLAKAINSPFSDLANVTIGVLKGASIPPTWTIPATDNLIISVLESQYLGMFVYQVKARDPDEGPSGLITYSFLVEQSILQKTADFMINPVTGVIRAERVFDREEKDLYTLLLLARDHSKNPQDITRRLRIRILDVNDNQPEFPTADGKVIPHTFEVPEDAQVGFKIGNVKAFDKDLNPSVFYFIISGNDEKVFRLDEKSGALYLMKTIDREKVSSYTLNIEAVNNITEFNVIRPRNRRDASVTTVKILVTDRNDEKPTFTKREYYGCVSTHDTLMKSIVKVQAIDKDALGNAAITYSIGNIKPISTDSSKVFLMGERDGILRNTEIMSKYDGTVFSMDVFGQDTVTTSTNTVIGKKDQSKILVFVTKKSQTVKIVLNQPPTDVYFFLDQIKTLLSEKTGGSYVCVVDIKEHMLAGGEQSKYWSDLFVYLINKDSKKVLLATESAEQLNNAKIAAEPSFSGLYINKIEVGEQSEVEKERIPLLIIMILVILFIILALLLTCCAFWCIARSKRKKIEKATYESKMMMVENEKNPVYSNRGFISDDAIFIAGQHQDVVYSNNTETIEQVQVVDSPLYTQMEKSNSEFLVVPNNPDPPLGPEPVIEVPLEEASFDDPAVYTVPNTEPIILQPVSEIESEPVPYIVSSLQDPEPIIETEPIDLPAAGMVGAVGQSGELSGHVSRASSSAGNNIEVISDSQRSSLKGAHSPNYSTVLVSSVQSADAVGELSRPASQMSSSAVPQIIASVPASQRSSMRDANSLHSSLGGRSFQASLASAEMDINDIPVIVTSPEKAESPTEALQQIDAVIAAESH